MRIDDRPYSLPLVSLGLLLFFFPLLSSLGERSLSSFAHFPRASCLEQFLGPEDSNCEPETVDFGVV